MDRAESYLRERDEYVEGLNIDIATAGTSMREATQKLFPALKEMRDKNDYAGYISFGTNLVEFTLKKLIVVYIHAINFNLRTIETDYKNSYLHDLVIEVKQNQTAGESLKILKERFSFPQKHKELYDNLMRLTKTRNETLHKLIEIHKGDLAALNDELRPYSLLRPVEDCFKGLLDVQAEIATDLRKKSPNASI